MPLIHQLKKTVNTLCIDQLKKTINMPLIRQFKRTVNTLCIDQLKVERGSFSKQCNFRVQRHSGISKEISTALSLLKT